MMQAISGVRVLRRYVLRCTEYVLPELTSNHLLFIDGSTQLQPIDREDHSTSLRFPSEFNSVPNTVNLSGEENSQHSLFSFDLGSKF
ncbi:hypothetical protein MPTK1_1g28550 [Marchantia polymorpha subsp. ruderalis]|uniref:Uncharacterized protein n=2 Tax=Marchantia polymorpha TaxID=3197 RepID=A0AAF6AV94_MARPO|nr:hypothetical protein MARPO_0002s0025 [Marchantia polymorpha]BBN00365.1 hypothetical protein Mp_1g28550 [Marchantia polymorpha subsp. ruderalis]|eukprot:PTQ49518.1 hypothetical protein MARPO_0002s0025 [Marchantia polymorpha]